MPIRTANRLAALILVVFAVNALRMAAFTPPGEPPDELAHFLYADHIARTGQLPILAGRAEVFASFATQRHQPPLYYLIGAVLIAPTTRADVDLFKQPNPFAAIGFAQANNLNVNLHRASYPGDTLTAFWILRLFSLGLACATLWLIYRTAWLGTGQPTAALSALFLAAAIPTVQFISASINNDNMVTFGVAAGVFCVVHLWRHGAGSWRRMALYGVGMGVAVVAATLGKVTGAGAAGIIGIGVLYGTFRGRYRLLPALVILALAALISLIGVGAWLLRNYALYGDFLAMNVSLAVWGRGAWGAPLADLLGLWESFWYVLGHMNVRGPDWVFPYAGIITVLGLIGAGIGFRRTPAHRDFLALCALIGVTVFGTFWAVNQQAGIAQGRILFPALIGIAPVLTLGWGALLGRYGTLLALPLMVAALSAPIGSLAAAYPALRPVDSVPSEAIPLTIVAESMRLDGLSLDQDTIRPGQTASLTLYFSGQHPEKPYLFVKYLYSLAAGGFAEVGGIDVYPGMAPTDDSGVDGMNAARLLIPIRAGEGRPPAQLQVQIGWRSGRDGRYLPLTDGAGRPLDGLLIPGPTYTDPAYVPPLPATPTAVVYGGQLRLWGYSLPPIPIRAGEPFTLDLVWEAAARPDRNWTLSVGVLDDTNALIAQADSMIVGYPTRAWRPGVVCAEQRTLTLPPDTPSGDYRLSLTWYDLATGERLPITAGGNGDPTRYTIPIRVE
jgi:hypothetical protein